MNSINRMLAAIVFAAFLGACSGGNGGNGDNNNGGDDRSTDDTDSEELSSKFGSDAYLPIIEGSSFTYSDGGIVTINNVDWSARKFEVNNATTSPIEYNPSGELLGLFAEDGNGFYVTYQSYSGPAWLPVSRSFSHDKLLYENKSLYVGFTWSETSFSNGYEINSNVMINKLGTTCQDGDGTQYDDCIEVQVDYVYPQGYGTQPQYLTQQIFLLARGIGYVDRTMYFNDSSQANVSLVSYFVPDE